MSTDEYSPERIADRLEIQDVMFKWCRAIDRRDYDRVRDVFFPDAVDNHGLFDGGVEALIAWLRERHENIPYCSHLVTNMLIEFADRDVAVVETHVTSTQYYPAEPGVPAQVPGGGGAPGMPMTMLAFARYADRFERRGGEWRIARRTAIFDTQMVFEARSDPALLPPGCTVSRRDAEDHIFALRREAGLA